MTAERVQKPPKHLKPATRRWWSWANATFALEPHHLRLLTLAGEFWDRGEAARELIATEGLTFTDRFNCPREHPAVKIARDSGIAFARVIRELRLDAGDVGEPGENGRPPRLVDINRRRGA